MSVPSATRKGGTNAPLIAKTLTLRDQRRSQKGRKIRTQNKESIMKKTLGKAIVLILVLIISNICVAAQTRIRFARGSTSASVSSSIGGYASRSYVLGARYGQLLSANISSRNGCVTFSNGASSISYVTESGNNYLYLKNGCRGTTGYTLTVSINYGSD